LLYVIILFFNASKPVVTLRATKSNTNNLGKPPTHTVFMCSQTNHYFPTGLSVQHEQNLYIQYRLLFVKGRAAVQAVNGRPLTAKIPC
jgi:hypothetical protein